MHITLEKKAIVFRIKKDSPKLFPIMHFVKNSFENVKYFSSLTIISEKSSEIIRKKYLLKWAYNNKENKNISLNDLNDNLSLPIHIINLNNKYVENIVQITVSHLSTNNELHIRCNQFNHVIISTFEKLFKNSIVFDMEKKNFRININTKYDLAILKSILSRKKISGVSVVFITKGLNFSELHRKEIISEEQAYLQKLQKSYKVLSVDKNSSEKQIKTNYKKLLRRYHPDKVSSEGVDTVNLYTKRFQVIQEAYGFIKEHQVQ